ncbi:MAG: hypothetical protein ACLFV7_00915 [Phycisphaerae bacterium]
MTGHTCFRILVLCVTVAVLAGGCGTGDPGRPEQAYWSTQRDIQGNGGQGLGVRRRMRRRASLGSPKAQSLSESAHAAGPGRPGVGDAPEPAESPLAEAFWNDELLSTSPYEGEGNLDVRPTLAESFLEQSAERGIWFGIGQALGGGYVSVALFGARQVAEWDDY